MRSSCCYGDEALRSGYAVVVAVDACGGLSDRTESAALAQMRDSGALVCSVISIVTALHPDFSTPDGNQVFEMIKPFTQ